MGRRLRVSLRSSPISRRRVLPWGMHKPWAGSNRYQISELFPFTVAGPPAIHSSSLPFCERFKIRLQLMVPIRILQHSILGAWLVLTQAGSPPARQSDLASPHVHRLVRAFGRNDSPNHRRSLPMYPIGIAVGNRVSQFTVGTQASDCLGSYLYSATRYSYSYSIDSRRSVLVGRVDRAPIER